MTHLRRGGLHTQTGSIRISAPPETVWELITTVNTGMVGPAVPAGTADASSAAAGSAAATAATAGCSA